jgi:hypothetical protein
MAIAYQAISTVATKTTTSNGSLTLNAPAGVTDDDLLVACISFRGATTPSLPADWNLIERTTVTGNTSTNNTAAIASGLMAWIKRGATNPDFEFGAVTGEQFPNLAFGYVVRITGQDLTDPLAGSSVNTLASANSTVTTGGYTRSFLTATADDYIEIMLCMGSQEVTWSTQQYETGPTAMTEVAQEVSTGGADGSIAVAVTDVLGDPTGGFSAVSSAARRNALIVASFGGPRPTAAGYSFSTFF